MCRTIFTGAIYINQCEDSREMNTLSQQTLLVIYHIKNSLQKKVPSVRFYSLQISLGSSEARSKIMPINYEALQSQVLGQHLHRRNRLLLYNSPHYLILISFNSFLRLLLSLCKYGNTSEKWTVKVTGFPCFYCGFSISASTSPPSSRESSSKAKSLFGFFQVQYSGRISQPHSMSFRSLLSSSSLKQSRLFWLQGGHNLILLQSTLLILFKTSL